MSSVRTVSYVGKYSPSEQCTVSYPLDIPNNNTVRLVMAFHGRNSDSTGFSQTNFGPHTSLIGLVATGRYLVCSIDGSSYTNWGGPGLVSAAAAAQTWVRSAFSLRATKYGIDAWSMGGVGAANVLKRDAANIAAVWTWAGAVDLDWAYSTVGHSPQAGQPAYATEIDAAYGSYAATAGYRIWNEATTTYRAINVPWMLAHATDDATVPISVRDTFVANAANSKITSYTPAITSGGHTALFGAVPNQRFIDHFDSGSW